MAFPQLSDLKPGDKLIADERFKCLTDGQECEVKEDPSITHNWPGAKLYVECEHGEHFLDGQENDDGEVLGLSRAI